MGKSEDTKQLILDTAKEEFLEKGYNDASVRNIAKRAGLTTGAIFRYFDDKESLFAALVKPVADYMLAAYQDGDQRGFDLLSDGQHYDMWDVSKEVLDSLVNFIFENSDTFSLLINKSAGSNYENFVDEIVEEETKQTYKFMQEMKERGYKCQMLNPDEIHVLISAQYYAFFEIVRHGMKKTVAIDKVYLIADFFSYAWKKYFES
ncbi:TetR/AcrR family transcriptional regulator [Dialister invisus]|uniref:TetR/AcrR family transcriptional regulator n=1 Tax=Dialister invisus TaxID=218538 RepID=UPI0028809D88|nr:TetR/AcrR family transcriptional regulator [Dialister invisus]